MYPGYLVIYFVDWFECSRSIVSRHCLLRVLPRPFITAKSVDPVGFTSMINRKFRILPFEVITVSIRWVCWSSSVHDRFLWS
jgi:hypothetical protein